MIRLTGNGQEGKGGGEPGNLYLRVTFAKHPDFRARGGSLLSQPLKMACKSRLSKNKYHQNLYVTKH
jgi:DnaJ-class molecular chaperone